MAEVFISYAREDQAFVRRLHAALHDAGREAWVDWEGIPPTAEWMAEVRQAIVGADGFLFVVSPASVGSRVCAEELGIALETNTRLVPLLRQDVAEELLPEAIAAHNWIPFREEDDFEPAFDRLIRALDTDLEWVRAHTRLQVRASEWDRRGRDRSFLLRGSDLEEAEEALAAAAEKVPPPTRLQTEYVHAGRRAAAHRQRGMVAAVSLGLLVAVVLAVFALIQRGQAVRDREAAREAQAEAEREREEADRQRDEARRQRDIAEQRARESKSGELAAQAINLLQVDPELSLLLARAAGQVATTPQAEDALRQALQRSNVTAVLRGHTGPVVRAAFSPQGTRVATASWDGAGRVWDPVTGETTATLATGDEVYDLAFSPDGALVATVGGVFSSAVGVWDPATGDPVATIPQPGFPRTVDISPDSTRVATAAGVWEARTGGPVSSFDPRVSNHNLATFSPDGRLVAVAPHFFVSGARHILTTSGRATVFDAKTGRAVLILPPDPAVSARFSPDGRRIAVTSGGTVTVWTVPAGKLVATLRARGSALLDARWSRDGRSLVTAEESAVSHVWDVDDERVVARLRGHGGAILVAEFSPDGRLVVTGGVDQTARVWSIATGRQVFVLRGATDWVFDARFGPDGASIVTASADGTARVWDVRSPPGGLTLTSGAGPVHDAAFTPDGRFLVTGTGQEDTAIRVWDTITGDLQRTLCCHLGPQRLAMSPRGDLVGAALGRMEAVARVWDLPSGRQVFERRVADATGPAYVNDIAFDAEGRLLLAGPNATATLWDPRTERRLRRLEPGPGDFPDLVSARPGPGGAVVTQAFEAEDGDVCVVGAAEDACSAVVRVYGPTGSLPDHVIRTSLPEVGFLQGEAILSRDGRWIAASGGEAAALLDAASGDQVAGLEHPVPPGEEYRFSSGVQAVFAPDGSILATAAGPSVRLWSVPGGELLATLGGHDALVSRIAFSPDGSLLVSAGHDRTARVWTVPGGELSAVLQGQGGQLNDAAFSSDGRALVTTSDDGTARVWPVEAFLPYSDLVELADARVTRDLTPAELEEYLGPFSSEVRA